MKQVEVTLEPTEQDYRRTVLKLDALTRKGVEQGIIANMNIMDCILMCSAINLYFERLANELMQKCVETHLPKDAQDKGVKAEIPDFMGAVQHYYNICKRMLDIKLDVSI